MRTDDARRIFRKPAAAIAALFLGGTLQGAPLVLSLPKAIDLALKHNEKLKIAKTRIDIAKTRTEQARSALYPQLDLALGVSRRDEDINYLAAGSFDLPRDFTNQLALSAADVQDELTSMLTGAPKQHTNLQNAYDAISAGALSPMSIPFEMDITTLGRDSASAGVDLSYALFTGGKVDALLRQARLNEKIERENYRKSRSEVIFRTRRFYYAAMLAEKIALEAEKTLVRMETVRDLTEAFYRGDSLRVKKTDYLRTLVTVDLVRSMLEQSQTAAQKAKSALVHAMGLPYDTRIELGQKEFPLPETGERTEQLVKLARRYNPDYSSILLAVEIADAKVEEKKSGYLPSVGLYANASHYYNSYEGGLYTDQNKNSWTVGVGLEWNLFRGFLDRARVEEAALEKLNRQRMRIRVEKGLALRIQTSVLELERAVRQYRTLKEAANHALQNADLHIRAYRQDMVSTKDVIEAQLTEAFTRVAYFRSLHDYALNRARIDYLLCRSVEDSAPIGPAGGR